MKRVSSAGFAASPSAGRHLERQAELCREAVCTLLRECLGGRRPADRVLLALFRSRRELGGRDRRLISETSFALLRWWGWLQVLAPNSEQVPAALLVAATVLEGLPLPAAGAVWLRECGLSAAEVERLAALPEPRSRWLALAPRLGVAEGDVALAALVPPWFLSELVPCPRPFRELLGWLQRRPPVWLRVQRGARDPLVRELQAADFPARPHPRLMHALDLGRPPRDLRPLPAYREGRVEVQDLASQAIGQVCSPRVGQRWWDACAGGGGKTLHLAGLMEGKGSVLATDVRRAKLEELRRRARRAGLCNIRVRPWSGEAPDPRQAAFDGVLVDVPCSGSGTWRRNPDARWRIEPETLDELVALQGRLLAAAAQAVRPGGALVYATCSLLARENEGQIAAFLAARSDFSLEPFEHPLKGEPCATGMLQIWPWDGDCDAMFVARLRRGARGTGDPA